MKVDNEGILRPNAWPEGGSIVYLGDVTRSLLSSLGPHSPPEFIERPGFDEQRWTISVQSNELKILIKTNTITCIRSSNFSTASSQAFLINRS